MAAIAAPPAIAVGQGISDSSFNDKVRRDLSCRGLVATPVAASRVSTHRARWNTDKATGQAHRGPPLEHERSKGCVRARRATFELLANISAVADAVRTSLGPKGMDKMVSLELRQHLLTTTDYDWHWRGCHYQRRSYHPAAHGGAAPRRAHACRAVQGAGH